MYDVKVGVVRFLDGDYKGALEYFYEGAAEGDAEAAFNYAYMLSKGIGTDRDPNLARSFYIYASTRIGEAAYNLAIMHLHGVGAPRDYRKFVEYMQDAAGMDIIEAQLYLGIAHTIGLVFEPDIISISRIPYHTAEYRDPYAYIEGEVEDLEEDEESRIRAVRFDPVSAFEYFRMAARHSPDYVEELSHRGKFLYARCFIDGLGTDFNRDRGNNLMLIAAAEGSREAMVYLETEAPYMLEALENTEKLDIIRRAERIGGAK